MRVDLAVRVCDYIDTKYISISILHYRYMCYSEMLIFIAKFLFTFKV